MDPGGVDHPSGDGATSGPCLTAKSPQKYLESPGFMTRVGVSWSKVMDRNFPSSMQPGAAEKLGFLLEVDGAEAPMPCKLVQGFDEALVAAKDPRIPMPSRLVIGAPDQTTFEWLASWSEDVEQVRRTIRIHRCSDAQTVIAVVTLAAFGRSIPTGLTIESITLPSQRRRIVRSGVHPKSFLSTIRAHYERTLQQPSGDDADAFLSDLPSDDDA